MKHDLISISCHNKMTQDPETQSCFVPLPAFRIHNTRKTVTEKLFIKLSQQRTQAPSAMRQTRSCLRTKYFSSTVNLWSKKIRCEMALTRPNDRFGFLQHVLERRAGNFWCESGFWRAWGCLKCGSIVLERSSVSVTHFFSLHLSVLFISFVWSLIGIFCALFCRCVYRYAI